LSRLPRVGQTIAPHAYLAQGAVPLKAIASPGGSPADRAGEPPTRRGVRNGIGSPTIAAVARTNASRSDWMISQQAKPAGRSVPTTTETTLRTMHWIAAWTMPH